MRTLGAVGTFVWDTNWHPSVLGAGGAPLRQWGGAAYSLAALSATCPPGWRVAPIVKVGADLAEEVQRYLARLPHLELGLGLRVVPEPNNRVELRYRDAAHREEILTGGVPPWRWPELAPIAERLDAIYLNYLSGYELGLDATRELRAGFAGLVYGDLHSLFLGPPSGGARPPRALPDWEQWIGCLDVVQLNETELELLAGGADPDRLLAELLELGPSLVAVTLGERGVRYVARRGLPLDPLRWRAHAASAAHPVAALIPPPLGRVEGDPTGCGDVWGAAFLASLLAGLGVELSVERAQRLAAAKIARPDTRALHETLSSAAARADHHGG